MPLVMGINFEELIFKIKIFLNISKDSSFVLHKILIFFFENFDISTNNISNVEAANVFQ
jgi:hypothetical protein